MYLLFVNYLPKCMISTVDKKINTILNGNNKIKEQNDNKAQSPEPQLKSNNLFCAMGNVK